MLEIRKGHWLYIIIMVLITNLITECFLYTRYCATAVRVFISTATVPALRAFTVLCFAHPNPTPKHP